MKLIDPPLTEGRPPSLSAVIAVHRAAGHDGEAVSCDLCAKAFTAALGGNQP